MTVVAWVLAGLVAWFVIAVLVAKWLGRTVRVRDRQIPRGQS